MRIFDILAFCWRNLTRRKIRTALTAFGVVIGVCAILVMISIGIGLSQFYDQMLSGWGDLTVITVHNWSSNNVAGAAGGGKSSSASRVLDDATVAKIQAMPGVEIATPFYQVWNPSFQLKNRTGRYIASVEIYGVYPEALEKMGYKIKEGEYLKEGDREYSLVVGEQFAYRFRDAKKRKNNRRDPYPDASGNIPDPFVNVMKDQLILFSPSERTDSQGNKIGKDLEVRPTVVGILAQSDQHWEATNSVFMDINELKALVQKYNKQNGLKVKDQKINYEDVRVKCVDVESVESVQAAIKEMGFDCYSMNDSRQMMQEQSLMIQMVLGGLAAISLFVAAIGIANTMVMSIYERTREIGVMKVIGAEVRDIRVLFLMEAGMIGLIGGVAGVVLSYIASFALNTLAAGTMGAGGGGGTISVIPIWLVAFALVFSMFIGILFGFLPANRAVKISALEAIKHD